MAQPNYKIRRSPRAKNLRLKVTAKEGLTVIIPKDFDEEKIISILRRKKNWIEDALTKAKHTRRFLEPDPINYLPEHLNICALNENWRITYRIDKRKTGIWLRVKGNELELSSANLYQTAVIERLKKWLRQRIREELIPLVNQIANQKMFKFKKILVRNQRTRWASCSSKRNLSLNIKLLFLSPELVRYVLIHELCHTIHMNHSNDFWRLVESHEPDFRVLDIQLREAWKKVPQWMF